MSRAAVVVLDACGVGAAEDAEAYGDADADTLGHLAAAVGGLDVPTLGRLTRGMMARWTASRATSTSGTGPSCT